MKEELIEMLSNEDIIRQYIKNNTRYIYYKRGDNLVKLKK